MLEGRRCGTISALEKALRGLPVCGSNSTWPASKNSPIHKGYFYTRIALWNHRATYYPK